MNNPIWVIVGALVIAGVFFSRAFFLWYFKINDLLASLQRQNELLAKIAGEPVEPPEQAEPLP